MLLRTAARWLDIVQACANRNVVVAPIIPYKFAAGEGGFSRLLLSMHDVLSVINGQAKKEEERKESGVFAHLSWMAVWVFTIELKHFSNLPLGHVLGHQSRAQIM